MDSTKKVLGVMTMVHKDYFFLERWYQYYSKQVGAENLYILSHGNDPEHRRIAKGANVLNLPREETMFQFDRRRWRMMSHVATGLLDFYNWMIVSDVDEIVIVDPKAAMKIVDYLQDKYDGTQEYFPALPGVGARSRTGTSAHRKDQDNPVKASHLSPEPELQQALPCRCTCAIRSRRASKQPWPAAHARRPLYPAS